MSTGEHSFTIPRSSYIASLLTVLGADALSNYGKGVFVGGYPGIWHNDKPDLITELLTRKDTNERVLQYSNDNDLFFKSEMPLSKSYGMIPLQQISLQKYPLSLFHSQNKV